MKNRQKRTSSPQWAQHITALRERIGINQAELARRMDCSAMTISRWERGLLQPSAEHFIQLGNLGDRSEAWFFWEMGGIQASKVVDALDRPRTRKSFEVPRSAMQRSRTSATSTEPSSGLTAVPVLRAVVGTQGSPGDRRSSLQGIAVSTTLGIPSSWCPNPSYTSLLRVKGHSMEPLIRQGDLVAVDSFQTERSELYGHIIVAGTEQTGLCVSRLRHYDSIDLLESEDRKYDSVVLSKASRWRIVGKVLWWISGAQNSV
jgi:phage repressor protein C with HTH and peptisase S24 domain